MYGSRTFQQVEGRHVRYQLDHGVNAVADPESLSTDMEEFSKDPSAPPFLIQSFEAQLPNKGIFRYSLRRL